MARIREPLGLRRLDILWGSLLGILIETITCILRFVLDLQSTRDTAHLRHFTFGFRIHHGYIGLMAMAFAMWLTMPQSVRRWGFIIGTALLVSDLVHHFVVLWYTTGSPQFDLVYPPAAWNFLFHAPWDLLAQAFASGKAAPPGA